ncbi:GNAT family N-acetyltransferase [Teredinibacter sp. KSP-S5-2]|uniref:GNAT family N-acetyltransferase n=1 Tax=Teredinibacter sp. KSP-S5-2 TaxID=3034506 RepID=UPI0029341CC3|nr:GNAT family N-acetyltransferase [Teredinibacter sp. KSP-S5-2]WNO08500.1 GNAT family N-acetyltransferase [Teredinibacter sp. KSP-S5-2]
MNIVQAKISDATIVSSVICSAHKDVAVMFALNSDNCPKHPSFCEASWVESDIERGVEYFLYQENGEIAGCVSVETASNGQVVYLNRLSVLPVYRSMGIGGALVRFVLGYAKSQSRNAVSIGIISRHTKLKNWYRGLGFVDGDVKTFPHLPFDVLFMSYVI